MKKNSAGSSAPEWRPYRSGTSASERRPYRSGTSASERQRPPNAFTLSPDGNLIPGVLLDTDSAGRIVLKVGKLAVPRASGLDRFGNPRGCPYWEDAGWIMTHLLWVTRQRDAERFLLRPVPSERVSFHILVDFGESEEPGEGERLYPGWTDVPGMPVGRPVVRYDRNNLLRIDPGQGCRIVLGSGAGVTLRNDDGTLLSERMDSLEVRDASDAIRNRIRASVTARPRKPPAVVKSEAIAAARTATRPASKTEEEDGTLPNFLFRKPTGKRLAAARQTWR